MNKDETNDLLRQILKWQKLQGVEILKNKIRKSDLFSERDDVAVYFHSDGIKSSRDIAKLTRVNHMKVQRLWKKWAGAGLVEPTEKFKGGRFKRLFDVGELGVKVAE